jgi:hypothetical protein
MIIKVSTRNSIQPNPVTGLKSTKTTCSKCICRRKGTYTIIKKQTKQLQSMAAKSLYELLGE